MQLAYVFLGYFFGSMLFGYRITWLLKGVDIRKLAEDENPGTYNAFVFGGFWCGILTLLADMAKGFVPVYAYVHMTQMNLAESNGLALVLAAPVAGHIFPVWHHFKGGKGIAVSFGVLLALFPIWKPVLLLAFFYILFSVVFKIRSHRRRSIVTFGCFCVGCLSLVPIPAILLGCVLISCIVIYKHHLMEEKSNESANLIL